MSSGVSKPSIAGMHYVGYYEGCYDSDVSEQLIKWMASATGSSWICINSAWTQESISSTQIYYPAPDGPTLIDLKHAVQYAHSQGLKVALKPVRTSFKIDCVCDCECIRINVLVVCFACDVICRIWHFNDKNQRRRRLTMLPTTMLLLRKLLPTLGLHSRQKTSGASGLIRIGST